MAPPQELDPPKRPTLRTIAAEAGVTHATVSMALRDHPLISAKTRKKIRRIADRLGYRPDPEVAKLMHHLRLKHKPQFQSTIAAITSISEQHELHYVMELRRSAERAAKALGYGFSLYRVEAGAKRNASLQRILRARGVEGILLLPMAETVALSDYLEWGHFAVVAATYGVLAPDFQRIVPDQFGNTLAICKQLAQLGHRRIGLVIDTRTDLVVDHRFSAAVIWQNTVGGAEHVEPLLHHGDFRVGLKQWFARQRPDAIIVGTETEAQEVARELGLRLPGKVEFAVTDHPGSSQIGGIDQRPEEIGIAAIAQLHAKVQSGAKGAPAVPGVLMIKGRWVDSTRSRRGKGRKRNG